MAKIVEIDGIEPDEMMREEDFLARVQCKIQEELDLKGVRYRDLSKRLGVSEARVSQMFGDEAANLTIRTIARIFARLGETPVLLSERELAALLAGRHAEDDETGMAWQVLADEAKDFAVPHARVIQKREETLRTRATRSQDWIEAEHRLSCIAGT